MKKNFLTLILGILIISCSSNDDNTETMSLEEKILEGTWNFQRHGEVCSNGFDLGEGNAYEFRFLTDNTVDFTDPGYLTSSHYELNGNELILETTYTLPSGSTREFIGNYIYSENNGNFTGTNTFNAYDDGETLWTCNGTTSIFK
ncbi:hypothetical protein ACFSQ0_07365 [Mesonia sediminis]|uniref:Lipocalin-like domain-containing protein n=1 Tax=Mesonia sediminis TaxID=1703946 RepID=A0ABW5SGG7_9FLAO